MSAPFRTIQLQRDTSANWTSANTLLANGELGLEMDTRKAKIGDGVTNWNALSYAFSSIAPTITLTGDVSGSGTGSFVTTIGALKVLGSMIAGATIDLTTKVTGLLPFANIASVATGSILYRKTAATGPIETQTIATLKTDLVLVKADVGLSLVDNTSDATKNSAVATLTNKRNTKRVVVTTQSATPAINTDNGDVFQITGLAQAITSMTTSLTGTPVSGDMMMIQITDNGTVKGLTFGASFASTTVTLPTTTVASVMLRVLFQRNNANTIWDCISVN